MKRICRGAIFFHLFVQPGFDMVAEEGLRYSTINYSSYDARSQHKSTGGSKEKHPTVKSYRAIETTIVLDSKAMKELKDISYYQNKPNQTFSDLIVFLIKQYRLTQLSQDPVTRHIISIHQQDD